MRDRVGRKGARPCESGRITCNAIARSNVERLPASAGTPIRAGDRIREAPREGKAERCRASARP
ncbi:hypothetical protein DF122_02165 [Burkholderia pseudomallei]|nr:hypothetical protein BOC35_21720 [Burkholderia pseudomallei]ARK61747.1 hypothetical protein BOC37_17395 [Burkholderia pseudomallei]ARK88646.1 hypothetical protein BOC42_15770 [Burkholderia pseudomallei]ARL08206.1 hypothetical protein BOC45_04625 [Burkholderia pseudomallei]ARL23231.1 hypothetical protein BOC47_13180 [Burkholderia pseudomallei]